MARLHILPRPEASLHEQQRRRARGARHRGRASQLDVLRFRLGRTTCRRDLYADRNLQTQRRRSPCMARRRAPVELEGRQDRRRPSRSTAGQLTGCAESDTNTCRSAVGDTNSEIPLPQMDVLRLPDKAINENKPAGSPDHRFGGTITRSIIVHHGQMRREARLLRESQADLQYRMLQGILKLHKPYNTVTIARQDERSLPMASGKACDAIERDPE